MPSLFAESSYSGSHYNSIAGPSSRPLSPEFDADDEMDLRECERALEKQRECASRVAAWITQSAIRSIPAYTAPSTASIDLDDDFDLEVDEALASDDSDDASWPCKTIVIHAPIPRRPSRSRSRSRRHHHDLHQRLRTPSPSLYSIQEEDSE